MRHKDIAIVGGGLAGSTAAAMLGRAGIATVLVDPHERYPEDLRCEKLDADQLAILERTGLAPAVLRAATHEGTGLGLANVCQRLEARWGNRASCRYGPMTSGGFKVSLTIPVETNG